METKIERTLSFWLRAVLIAAMVGTLIFIFYNSSLPKKQSSEQSGVVEEIVDAVIPDEVPVKNVILENIRKIAHFSEYGLLGIEVSLYVFFFLRKKIYLFAPASLLLCVLIGFFDESIQMLSDRGPMISDVWIDVGGFTTFALLSYAVLYIGLGIVKLWQKHTEKKKTDGSAKDDAPVR